MKNTMYYLTLRGALLAAVVSLWALQASAQCCTRVVASTGQEYRLEYTTVSEPVEQTAYKKVVETNYVEEEVTTYETVWETEQRERRYTVARTVPETSVRQRRYSVSRPVEETVMKDTSYNVTRLLPETSEKEERFLVSKQVYETQQREVVETRKVPVQETMIQDRLYSVSKPVTTFVEQTVDRGGYVEQVNARPGRTYHRLAWQRAGEYYDPVAGRTRWHLPGFYWTPMEGPARYEVNKIYQPNFVTQTVPVTNFVQEQRLEQIPVTRTTFRDEQVSRIEEVQVPRTVQEEVVRKVPITTYKQVVERVERQTPVKVQRLVTEERVEDVPVTEYKTVMEERVEPYEVKVAKVVPVKRTVRKPITVEKWVPYTYTVERKRVVVNRIPITPAVTTIIEKPVSNSIPRLNPDETLVGDVVDQPAVRPTLVGRPKTAPASEAETSNLERGKMESFSDRPNDSAEEIPVSKK